jgi:hypothetical protein
MISQYFTRTYMRDERILESRTTWRSAEIYYPVMAAVTGPVLTFAPPAFLGTYSKN